MSHRTRKCLGMWLALLVLLLATQPVLADHCGSLSDCYGTIAAAAAVAVAIAAIIVLIAFLSEIFADQDGETDTEKATKRLKSAADDAYKAHPEYCNKSTAAVAKSYGISGLTNKNGEAISANDQVDYMKNKWQSVDAREAQRLANEGKLVIAGLPVPGDHGHTAVVVPGEGGIRGDGRFYPNVEGGGSDRGRSDGSKTAGDVWDRDVRASVKYYVSP